MPFYQRIRSVGYKAILPAVASWYLSGCAASPKLREETSDSEKTVLKFQRRDGTIEERVINNDDLIICTEEDIFGKGPKQKKE